MWGVEWRGDSDTLLLRQGRCRGAPAPTPACTRLLLWRCVLERFGSLRPLGPGLAWDKSGASANDSTPAARLRVRGRRLHLVLWGACSYMFHSSWLPSVYRGGPVSTIVREGRRLVLSIVPPDQCAARCRAPGDLAGATTGLRQPQPAPCLRWRPSLLCCPPWCPSQAHGVFCRRCRHPRSHHRCSPSHHATRGASTELATRAPGAAARPHARWRPRVGL